MTPTAWLNTHRLQAGVGGAGAVAAVALYRRHRAGSAGAAPPSQTATTSAVAPTSTYDSSGIDSYNQLANAISNQNDQISLLGTQLASVAAARVAPASSPVTPFNAYPLGTVLNPAGSKIIQSLPVTVGGQSGFLNVANTGGLYTSGIPGVSGAALGPPGAYSAQVNGKTVYEYTPTGVKTFKLGA